MRPAQEEDTLPTASIIGAVGGAVVLTIVCLLYVWLVMKPFTAADRGTAAPLRAVPPPATATPGPGDVDQVVFSNVRPFSAGRLEQQRRRLESYGVVDKDNGIVRIPVARAMELVAAGRTP
jgi:hypothetical protein